MHTRRNRLTIASLFALAFAAADPTWMMPKWMSRITGREPQNPYKRSSGGRGRPHQGKRERTRRIGGAAWDEYRASDRIRRGLPVSWPYQGVERAR